MSASVGTEANVRQAVPFFWVRDLTASLRFYLDGLGFRITHRWTPEGVLRWCWLELGDAAMMLQEFWREGPHENLPDTRPGVGVSICFQCRDAPALYREFRSRGLDAKRPFVGNRMWVTEVVDPDGYHLLFESPTNVPEETEYAE
jgi:catechol 2,3-dioxygenase-like lactoylglutathione lyase family enzyme